MYFSASIPPIISEIEPEKKVAKKIKKNEEMSNKNDAAELTFFLFSFSLENLIKSVFGSYRTNFNRFEQNIKTWISGHLTLLSFGGRMSLYTHSAL